MLDYDFDESIGYWLTITTQRYHRAFNDELVPYGITFRQSQVLGWLALEGDLSQSELAGRMMIEPPTLVRILDRMQRDGLITRRPCPEDRRRKLIHATAKSKPVWGKIIQCAKRIRARATDGLTDRQQATLKMLLGRVHENLMPGIPTAPSDR
ncbi:Transcriptional regulator SlyA [Stieleria maiorica]|uniref:Transcriptional regulator SlyA n=1 Tax=Stieleria maiorica TaxID=2795974 RepID=A0A5B9MQ61_9BACT|nr:MarR family transcriptional regulator [Stieleria maiorica]QEG01088.1 Transcriptional regulator SlyA [Stieleria maiorica]